MPCSTVGLRAFATPVPTLLFRYQRDGIVGSLNKNRKLSSPFDFVVVAANGSNAELDCLVVLSTAGCRVCGEDAGAAKGLQPIHKGDTHHHRRPAGRCGVGFSVDANPESDLAGFVEPSSVRAHRESRLLFGGAVEVECPVPMPEYQNIIPIPMRSTWFVNHIYTRNIGSTWCCCYL